MTPDEWIRVAVHRALDGIVRPVPDLSARAFERVRREHAATRKSWLPRWVQATGVLAVAAVVAVAGIALHQAASERLKTGPAPIATPNIGVPTSGPKGPGAAVAWLDSFTGIDASGQVVGRIPAQAVVRSPDGNELYGLGGQQVSVYSASTGALERTIDRRGSGDMAAITPDGHYLAILGGNPATVEIVDLAAGRSAAFTRLSSTFPNGGLEFVLVTADASRVVAVGNFWQKSGFVVLRFGGSTLSIEQQAVDGQSGHSLPSCDGMAPANAAAGLPERLLPDGNTMVSFCPGDGRVSWVDLRSLTTVAQVHVQEQNPFWTSPVFSTGSMLYVHEPGTGRITSIDLARRALVRSAAVNAPTASNALGWLADRLFPPALAGGIPRSAALSPDETVLYVTGAFGRGVGVAAIDVHDFHVISQWNLDGGGSLWLSGDGRSVFVTNNGGDRLSVLHLATGSLATVALTPPGQDFLPIPN